MFEKILLAVDGSENALRAAQLAGEMARLTGADLWIINAFDPVPSYLGEPNMSKVIATRTRQAEEIIAQARTEIGSIGGEIHLEMLEGPPAEAILNVAQARQIGLIIMGSRGLSRLAGLLLGSQSQRVVAQAECPVMLTR